jgi:hypothetical protein
MTLNELLIKDLIYEAELRSYEDWNNEGRIIKKGEKCLVFSDGEAYFQKEQTRPRTIRSEYRNTYSFSDGSFMDWSGIYERNEDASWSDDRFNCIESFLPNSY